MDFESIMKFKKEYLGEWINSKCEVCEKWDIEKNIYERADFEMVMCDMCHMDYRSGGKDR